MVSKYPFNPIRSRNLSQRMALGLILGIFIIAIASGSFPSWANPSLAPSSSRLSLGQPPPRVFSVGDIEFASVYLDGVALFQVAAQKFSPSESEPQGSLSPIQRRVQRIENNLHTLVGSDFDPQTLAVRPSILNNLTVIVASDQNQVPQQVVLTVNETDMQLNSSVGGGTDLAEQWSQIIQQALLRARQERQPKARQHQIIAVVLIVSGIIGLSFLMLGCQKWLRRRFNVLKKSAIEPESSIKTLTALPTQDERDCPVLDPLAILGDFRKQTNLQERLSLNVLLQRLNQVGLILLWFGGMAAVVYVFPETRFAARMLVIIPYRILIIWIVLMIVGNLVGLYVSHRLREWVEQAAVVSGNPERCILRAPTLREVSQGIIGFVSFWIAIVWFLTWSRVFPSSLLTGVGLVGAGLTFAFRDLFKDWIIGILIILEDQYAVGDMIEFEERVGTVEHMSLRATQVRGADGRLSTISHNQITTAHNLSKDWSRVNFTIQVACDTDPDFVIALMKQVAQALATDTLWHDDILDPVNVIGVNQVTHAGLEIMMRIRVKRLRQWDVEREFRRRLKLAFDAQGVQIGVPSQRFFFPEDLSQD